MRKRVPPKKSDTIKVASAGAAGGGVGTVIATFANSLPPSSPYKSALLIGSPLITVAVSGLWLFIKTVYVDPFVLRKRSDAADIAMDRFLEDARLNAKKVIDDPHASAEHKREVWKMVEDLEKLRLRKITERMEVVAVE